MKRVFADAFFFIAIINEDDEAHASAMKWLDEAVTGVTTTTAVLLEVADAMSAPALRVGCAHFVQGLIESSGTAIYPLNADLLNRGLALYRERPDKGWSLTDCVSFIVMADEGLTEALTGDRHFEQAGFVALLK